MLTQTERIVANFLSFFAHTPRFLIEAAEREVNLPSAIMIKICSDLNMSRSMKPAEIRRATNVLHVRQEECERDTHNVLLE